MDKYNFAIRLQEIHSDAVLRYAGGNRAVSGFFKPLELEFIHGIGHTAQEVFDFAEDAVIQGEPDFLTFLLIAQVRRDYFLHVQRGQPAGQTISMDSLPAKDAEMSGIPWLPRIIEKAKAKIQGTMPDDLMYGCGGDRKFFKQMKIHPADFLMVSLRNWDNPEGILQFVQESASGSC